MPESKAQARLFNWLKHDAAARKARGISKGTAEDLSASGQKYKSLPERIGALRGSQNR